MSEPTIEEQLAIVTNSRNALMMSNEQLYQENQKALADHAKALADQATKHQEAITKLNADHATALQTAQSDLATKTSQLEAVTQAKTALDLQVATLTTEKQSLTSQVDELQTDLDEANQRIANYLATIESLEAQVIELTPPPKPESVTPAQIRIWLLSNGIDLETVAGMIAAIPDETTRKIAQVRWEYGLVVLRNDPLVQQMGSALGLTVEQMDAAFLAASQIT